MIDVNGIGPFGRVIEMFAEKFLHAGVKRVSDLIIQSSPVPYKRNTTFPYLDVIGFCSEDEASI